MNISTKIAAVVLGLVQVALMGSAHASATFEDASAPVFVSGNISSGDLVFSSASVHSVQSRTNAGASNGGKYLAYLAGSGAETFAMLSGSAFNLTSIQLGGWFNFGTAPLQVAITGYRADLSFSTVSLTVNPGVFTTYDAQLTNFTNLKYVVLGTTSRSPAYVAVDNIITTPVPEPESVAMFLAGLGLLAGVQARRRKAR